jgi:hypothetical protein
MSFKDVVRDTGKHVQFAPANLKGTGRRDVPTAIAELARTETAPATENPTKLTTTGNSIRALRDLGKRTKIK